MIRIVVRVRDVGAAANVGGPVDTFLKSFDVESEKLEAYLRMYVNDGSSRHYTHAEIVGFELFPEVVG